MRLRAVLVLLAVVGSAQGGWGSSLWSLQDGIEPEFGSVRISKDVEGEAPEGLFAFDIYCDDTDKVGAGNAGTTRYGSTYIIRDDIPLWTLCYVVETETLGASATRWSVGDQSGEGTTTDEFRVVATTHETGEVRTEIEVVFINVFEEAGSAAPGTSAPPDTRPDTTISLDAAPSEADQEASSIGWIWWLLLLIVLLVVVGYLARRRNQDEAPSDV